MIERAAKIDPDSRDPHFEAGRLWLKKGRAREGGAGRRNRSRLTSWRYYGPAGPFSAGAGIPRVGRDADAERHAAAVRGD